MLLPPALALIRAIPAYILREYVPELRVMAKLTGMPVRHHVVAGTKQLEIIT